MVTQKIQTAVLATVLTIGGPVLGLAQSSQTKADTYTWNGELVSLDTTAKTMTVKSRVAYQEAISDLKHFKGGDRVWIVWSRIHDSSDAVRQVRRSETGFVRYYAAAMIICTLGVALYFLVASS